MICLVAILVSLLLLFLNQNRILAKNNKTLQARLEDVSADYFEAMLDNERLEIRNQALADDLRFMRKTCK